MAVLVVAEHDNQSVRKATLNAVAAAQKLGSEDHVLVAGHEADAAAKAAAQIAGVAKVLHADAPQLRDFLAENVAAVVVSVAKNYSHLLAPSTSNGKNVMPRVAALLDVQQVSDIVAVEGADTFVRPIYAGNALATVKSKDPIKVITVRTTAFDAVESGKNNSPVEKLESPLSLPEDHRLGRARHGERRELQEGARAARRQARRGHGRLARRGRRGLRAERLAGGADRQ